MKIINPNAPGRFQGAVEWFRINTPEDRYNLIGEDGEILLCEATGETWVWSEAANSWVSSGLARSGSTLVATDPIYGGAVVDVVVYGATPGGIAAAIAARRAGASVVLVEPSEWIGGMLTGGIAAPDTPWASGYGWGTHLICGLADEFFRRVSGFHLPGTSNLSQYRWLRENNYVYNLSVGMRVVCQMLSEAGINVVLGAELLDVSAADGKVRAIYTARGAFAAKEFVDATYEADLLPRAGISFSVGREAAALYSEEGAGVTSITTLTGVDPYVIPGDPTSGLIYSVEASGPGATGAADPRVQAFTFRFPMTKTGPKQTGPSPANYDPSRYEIFGRYAAVFGGSWTLFTDMVTAYAAVSPNFDINNKNVVSTNFVGPQCTEWITASYARRREIQEEIREWVLGLLEFMKTDSRIPAAARADAALYGFPANEFRGTNGFPPYLYVREGRRMVGDFVLTYNNISADNGYTDPIAHAYYTIDSHNCRRYNSGGTVRQEGAVSIASFQGSSIPLRVLFPKRAECRNLVPTFGVSCSRLAFCGIRMEPIHMAIGEAAGIVAALAALRDQDVQDVAYADIQPMLSMTSWYPKNPGDVTLFADNSRTGDGTVTASGTWTTATDPHKYGQRAAFRRASAAGATLTFAPRVTTERRFRVYAYWPVIPTAQATADGIGAFASATPITINHADGTTALTVSSGPTNGQAGGDRVYLGTYRFAVGAPSANTVVVGTDGGGVNTSWICAIEFKAEQR